jgi:hypothetical protein
MAYFRYVNSPEALPSIPIPIICRAFKEKVLRK